MSLRLRLQSFKYITHRSNFKLYTFEVLKSENIKMILNLLNNSSAKWFKESLVKKYAWLL